MELYQRKRCFYQQRIMLLDHQLEALIKQSMHQHQQYFTISHKSITIQHLRYSNNHLDSRF